MAKKEKTIYYWKWESIRRNKDYRELYDAYSRESDKTKKEKIKLEIATKWGITPADYHKNYFFLTKVTRKSVPDEPLVFKQQFNLFNILQADSWSEQSLEENNGNLRNIEFKSLQVGLQPLEKMKTLRLVLDIRYPKIVLTKRFKAFISLYQSPGFAKKFPIGTKRTKSDKNDYDKYFRVYDSYEKVRDWAEVAKKFYKKESGGLNYAKLKTRRDYNRCKKLIDGEWRHLS